MANITKAKLKSDSAGYALLQVPTLASDVAMILPSVPCVLGNPHNTLTEQSTGLLHIDGRTIYCKTINIAVLPSSATTKSVAHGITGAIDYIGMSGYTCIPTTGPWLPIPYADYTLANCISVNVTGANVVIGVGVSRATYTTCYVTLFYTK